MLPQGESEDSRKFAERCPWGLAPLCSNLAGSRFNTTVIKPDLALCPALIITYDALISSVEL